MSEAYPYLPEGWYKPNLDELGSICTGNTPPTSDQSNYGGALPFVGPSDLGRGRWINSCSERLTRKGELLSRTADKDAVLVSCIGILGKVGQASERLSFNQQINSMQPNKEKVDAGFLYYASSRLQGELNKLAGLQVVPIVNKTLFSKLEVLAPKNLEEQRWIANVLNTLDTQIQKTEALIAKLEKVKEGLLHDLLTRGIDENDQLRPSPEQAPERYKESQLGLGLVPREWACVAIGETATSTTLGTANRGAESSAKTKLIKMGNLNWGNTLSLINVESISARKVHGSLFLSDADLLFNTRNTPELVGKTCSWKGDGAFFTFDNNILRIRFSENLNGHFVASYMSGDIGRRRIGRLATGTTSVAAIYWRSLSRLEVPMPSPDEQQLIVDKVNSSQDNINALNDDLTSLQRLKAGLMDDLLTGRVRVTPLLDQAQITTPA
ncbi:restriction endonuclease subunit S [Halomonas tibetensis]|uniref:Restriction endonuclease subunit S n=1 Tax=Halomonas tibetensis TaxID=2259590 RepID=A0ABV7B3P7_9GAMM